MMNSVRPTEAATIAIIEDSPVILERLHEIYGSIPGVSVVGAATSVKGARELIAASKPSIISLDLWLEDGSSLELIPYFREQYPRTAIIVLTQNADAFMRKKATAAGATHFIDKSNGFTELSTIVRELIA
jgi:DNA-binding NarL/FixJ family response regulator